MNERLKQVNHQFADPNEAPAEPKQLQQYCWLGLYREKA